MAAIGQDLPLEKTNAIQVEHAQDDVSSGASGSQNAAELAYALETGKDSGHLSSSHLCSDEDSKRILRKTDICLGFPELQTLVTSC